MSKFSKDLAERVFWTAVAAAFAVVVPVLTDAVPEKYAVLLPAVAAAVTAVKGFLASKVGDPESAGTVDLRH